MIIAIRISGMVSIQSAVQETLHRMRLRKKYVASLFADTPENKKLLEGVRNYIAYGNISNEMLAKLLEARAEGIENKKIDMKKVLSMVDKKSLEELGVKPFFRLHPPRGGIESKKHAGKGKGVLGHHKENDIDKLVGRML